MTILMFSSAISVKIFIAVILSINFTSAEFLKTKNLGIVVVSQKKNFCLTELSNLPPEAQVIATGKSVDELIADGGRFVEGSILLHVDGKGESVASIIRQMPALQWIHTVHTGIDIILSSELFNKSNVIVTNSKGICSASLAEFVLGASVYFARDFARLVRQKETKEWKAFKVEDLRGKVMGIIGYGDVGRACATLAHAMGMKVYGLRQHAHLSANDSLAAVVVGPNQLLQLVERSDYLVITVPLTQQTRLMINETAFSRSKNGQVVISISRGAVIDEPALIRALALGILKGAALNVFTAEPLPQTSELWNLQNVLMAPHNMDSTFNARLKSVKFFTENVKRLVDGGGLANVVDIFRGY